MRGKVAKAVRKKVYRDKSYRDRTYVSKKKGSKYGGDMTISDSTRRVYQLEKKKINNR